MPDPLAKAPARLVVLLVAAVAAVSVIGLVTGTSPSSYRAKRPPLRERQLPGKVPPARTHAELEQRPWTGGPEASGWAESQRIGAKTAVRPNSEGEGDASIEAALAVRASRRAYDGAPPVVPHPVRANGAAECLACHADGFELGEKSAGLIPHAAYASCTQCHVTATAPFRQVAANPAAQSGSTWSGQLSPSSGSVAYAGAPPAVPHPTRMREKCESCHGPGGLAALKTPHRERRSCLQCHPATGGRGLQASR